MTAYERRYSDSRTGSSFPRGAATCLLALLFFFFLFARRRSSSLLLSLLSSSLLLSSLLLWSLRTWDAGGSQCAPKCCQEMLQHLPAQGNATCWPGAAQ